MWFYFIFISHKNEQEGIRSSDEESDFNSSSDDDGEWAKEVQRQHRLIRKEKRVKEEEEEEELTHSGKGAEGSRKQPKFFELRPGEEFKGVRQGLKRKRLMK